MTPLTTYATNCASVGKAPTLAELVESMRRFQAEHPAPGPTQFVDEAGNVVAEIVSTEFSVTGEIVHVIYADPKHADRIKADAEARGHKLRFVSREAATMMMLASRYGLPPSMLYDVPRSFNYAAAKAADPTPTERPTT
jgi:hypothetical protein